MSMKGNKYGTHRVIEPKGVLTQAAWTVYIAEIDYYEGGAHGINQRQIFNFINDTGVLIGLEDIFVPGYEDQLNEILLQALCEKVGVEDIHRLHENGYLFSMDMFPAKNFILNNETITFIYNPYEIASYDKGSTELTLPLEDLKNILRPDYMP